MPLKREEFLKAISRDHHFNLLLCWKIRTGISKNVELARIKKYVDWHFENQLLPHFKIEEEHIFPVLGNEHELVKKSLAQHRRLKRLFKSKNLEKSLSLIEEELELHVRFEERVLFPEIQATATEAQKKHILEQHSNEKFEDRTEDKFWE